ncbi:hypothetical protein N7478_001321 [Penicillium angulare]|uniref:uncharacterized protein n=1 Tax=Penicillium angulare TaxID=116970 RepID=UPI0025420936|nr:uncharacterized protein N7478_001321 [Penicillium angulare]KAJ5292070.1 hypothetical protein N7478_001321 [Penicillium angulare]
MSEITDEDIWELLEVSGAASRRPWSSTRLRGNAQRATARPESCRKTAPSAPLTGKNPTPGSRPRVEKPFSSNPCQQCVICGRAIKAAIQEGDAWKSFHQPLEMDDSKSQLQHAEKYPEREWIAIIHTCCWEVAWHVMGRPSLHCSLVESFKSHIVNLKPFIQTTPFDCETNDVDHELWIETPSDARIESGEHQKVRGIFSSVYQKDLSWIGQIPGPIHLEDVHNMDKFLAFCLMKGIPYQLASDKNTNVRPHLERALQSFKTSSPRRLPKTSNLKIAWDNAKSAWDAFTTCPPPQILPLDPELPGLIAVRKFRIPAERCHRVQFAFTSNTGTGISFDPAMSLAAFLFDGKLAGSQSPSASKRFALRIRSFRGIRFALAKNDDITAVRIKDGQRWSVWYGTPQYGSNDVEHEWDYDKKDLIFSYDRSGGCICISHIMTAMSELECP